MSKDVGSRRPGARGAQRTSRSRHAISPSRPADERLVHADPVQPLTDASTLARVVSHLAPETLHQFIRQRGLDACGELVTLATPEQLTSVLDLDLWRSTRPGRDEQFDTERFAEWLELLIDTGDAVAARIVAEIDEKLVAAGLSRYIHVFDPASFAPSASTDDEPIDAGTARPDGPACEVGGYVVVARRPDSWDAVVALLRALDVDHADYFHAVMCGCRRLSNSPREIDGLDNLLTEPEQLLLDVGLERECRQSERGYVTPADARAFLRLARERGRSHPGGTPSVNPVAAAYFRGAAEWPASADRVLRSEERTPNLPSTGTAGNDAFDSIGDLLDDAGFVPRRPKALLEGEGPRRTRLTHIVRVMEHVRDSNDTAYYMRSRELAFLANTLIAGCSIQARAFTPQEASDAAVGICNLGLEHWPARWPESAVRLAADFGVPLPDTFLLDHDLVTAFEVGWAVLHEDVSLLVAEQLGSVLNKMRCVDAEIQDGLHALRRELVRQRDAGTPWRARDALDAIAMLDMPAWASLNGLMDECPVLHAALTAILEGRTGAISATAFEFITTRRQLDVVREFMARLPGILSG
jgi:hypothetical protein